MSTERLANQLAWYPVAHKFFGQGLPTAAKLPLQCDEGTEFQSFRIGMFGLGPDPGLNPLRG